MLCRIHEDDKQRRRWWLCFSVAATGALVLLSPSVTLAAPSRPVVISDGRGDVSGPLDLRRFALRRALDGRLRVLLTFAVKITPETLLATSGPPGSACLRVWTDPDADPAATRAQRLVCVTARSNKRLRATVFEQRDAGLPRRVAPASVKLSTSRRSLAIRISQRALGHPEQIRFAAESTHPGCKRTTCIDTVPDAGATRSFRLRQ